ncbi:unnamed protein product [Adineta ricciae]|uniref:Uncharacterized protein n=1 Tax=Adineta ricciae TaxID=249248 RepID=A0A814BRH0_ADIRI|nr:unnamed protein product [Adineta ricciae]
MSSKSTNEPMEEEDEPKCGATLNKKWIRRSVNNAKNKFQRGRQWFQSGEVHPISETQQSHNQTTVNTVVQGAAAASQASIATMKTVAIVTISAGVTYALSKCTSLQQRIASAISSTNPTTEAETGSYKLLKRIERL